MLQHGDGRAALLGILQRLHQPALRAFVAAWTTSPSLQVVRLPASPRALDIFGVSLNQLLTEDVPAM